MDNPYSNSTVDNNNTTSKADYRGLPSIAASFPFEVIEDILSRLSIEDIMICATNVPKFWRDVIENSKEVWKRIAKYDTYNNGTIVSKRSKKSARDILHSDIPIAWLFSCTFSNGILYTHRRVDGSEGFIFAPTSEQLPLRVLDPSTKTANYKKGTRFGYGFIDLFAVGGELICSKQVTQNDKTMMWEYLSMFYSNNGPRIHKTSKKRKIRESRVEWDGDSEVMAHA